ncbi:MAG: PAS domain S-box protein [Spirochaetes bacterium]|nr:PAS domain S-box protein [Spirochaetota bacterium]
MLDLKTIMLGYIITSALTVLFITMLWRQNRSHYDGLGFWVAAFLLQMLGFMVLLLRVSIPKSLSIMLSNLMIVGGEWLLLVGLERFVGKPRRQWHNVVLLSGLIVFLAYFTYWRPALPARIILISAVLVAVTFQCADLLLRRVDKSIASVTRDSGIVFIMLTIVSLVRIAFTVFESWTPEIDFFHMTVLQVLVVLAFQMLGIALTFTLVMMVTSRLRIEGEELERERRTAEMFLRRSEERLSAVFRASPIGISLTRFPDGRIEEANDAFLRLMGFERGEVLGYRTTELAIWENLEERDEVLGMTRELGGVRDREVRFRRKPGETIDALISTEFIEASEERYILSVVSDITHRKRQELALAKALGEKESLLRELQHRIKNSLVMISSLIGLEANRSGVEPVMAALKEVKFRVNSVANLYTILYQTGNITEVALEEYLMRIVGSLEGSYLSGHGNVSIETRLEQMTVDDRDAAALGLILNELLTNSLKYAFPDGRAGRIEVTLRREAGGLVLTVGDNGVGLPGGFDPARSGGLGLELVRMLVSQLHGTFEYRRGEQGVSFTVRAELGNRG